MGAAPYFDRTKIAAAQVVAGFNADAFTSALEKTNVGILFGEDVVTSPQGVACADLLVRLCARLYPRLAILASEADTDVDDNARLLRHTAAQLTDLAVAINPNIEIADSADSVVQIGMSTVRPTRVGTEVASDQQREGPGSDTGAGPDREASQTVIYIGCDDWTGHLSTEHALPVGTGSVPVGAGIAACLAASALFRILLDPTAPRPTDSQLTALPRPPVETSFTLPERTALVGAGAIGQAFLWAIGRSPVEGVLHVVEPEPVELSNLQRYVLTDKTSASKPKTEIAQNYLATTRDAGGLRLEEHPHSWAEALAETGHAWELVAVAVDSAQARRQTQATLPHYVVNAWTQPGDLGVSRHDFINGACCACLYLPTGTTPNEDEIVAAALGVSDRLLDVRTLLYNGRPVPDELLDTVAERLMLDPGAIDAFRGSHIRDLYVVGICGGDLIPLAHNPGGAPVHVPLAHQSALAGVLLAARSLQVASELTKGTPAPGTEVTRVDVRRDPPDSPHQSQGKDPRGICLCQDTDYINAYQNLWLAPPPEAEEDAESPGPKT